MSDHDPRLRELTYRLVQMAPEAPPFPEEAVTQLKPRPDTKTTFIRQRRPWLVGIAAAAAVIVLVGLPLLVTQVGNGDQTPVTQPTVIDETLPPETVAPTRVVDGAPMELAPATVYFADGPVLERFIVGLDPLSPEGVLQFVIDLAADEGVGRFSFAGGTRLLGVGVEDGVASVDFNSAFYDLPSETESRAELGRVVFMLTEFDEIDAVLFLRNGEVADVEGIVLDGPQTRSDYFDLLPRIFIERPVEGATVPPTFTIRGLANTFEGTVQWRISLIDGTTVDEGFTTATCGEGCWGEFEIVIDRLFVEDTEVFIELWGISAEDDSIENRVELLVTAQGDLAGGEG